MSKHGNSTSYVPVAKLGASGTSLAAAAEPKLLGVLGDEAHCAGVEAFDAAGELVSYSQFPSPC